MARRRVASGRAGRRAAPVPNLERSRRQWCPACGVGELELHLDGTVGGRRAPFLACTACECCIEVPTFGTTKRRRR